VVARIFNSSPPFNERNAGLLLEGQENIRNVVYGRFVATGLPRAQMYMNVHVLTMDKHNGLLICPPIGFGDENTLSIVNQSLPLGADLQEHVVRTLGLFVKSPVHEMHITALPSLYAYHPTQLVYAHENPVVNLFYLAKFPGELEFQEHSYVQGKTMLIAEEHHAVLAGVELCKMNRMHCRSDVELEDVIGTGLQITNETRMAVLLYMQWVRRSIEFASQASRAQRRMAEYLTDEELREERAVPLRGAARDATLLVLKPGATQSDLHLVKGVLSADLRLQYEETKCEITREQAEEMLCVFKEKDWYEHMLESMIKGESTILAAYGTNALIKVNKELEEGGELSSIPGTKLYVTRTATLARPQLEMFFPEHFQIAKFKSN
jgi:hypothetical protein